MTLTVDTAQITADGGVIGSPVPSSFNVLKEQVLDYLDRPELSGMFALWVRLFEDKINRLLRTAGNENQVTLTPDATSGVLLPADYQAVRSVRSAAGRGNVLSYVTPDVFARKYPYPGDAGVPLAYTIEGQTLFAAPSGQAIVVDYYRGVPAYINGNLSNWLLIAHFDLYLYGVLTEAEWYLKNDGRAQMWQAQTASALTDLISADREARWGRAAVVMQGFTP